MAASLKPSGQSTKSMVIFEQKYFVTAIGQTVGSSKNAKAGANYYYVVFVGEMGKWNRHRLATSYISGF